MTDIFISYCHTDENWKDELKAHLNVLQHHGGLSVWDDRQIKAGDDWYPAIKQALEDEKLLRTVNVPAFELAQTEVTFEQYDACTAAKVCPQGDKVIQSFQRF